MRILHTADWHLGSTLEGRDRKEEQAAVLEEIVEIAREEDVDLVLVAGDVYDRYNPPAWAETLLYETLARLAEGGRQVVVLAGNHDSPERIAAAHPLAHERGIHLVGRVPEKPLLFEARRPVRGAPERIAVLPVPYVSEVRLREVIYAVEEGSSPNDRQSPERGGGGLEADPDGISGEDPDRGQGAGETNPLGTPPGAGETNPVGTLSGAGETDPVGAPPGAGETVPGDIPYDGTSARRSAYAAKMRQIFGRLLASVPAEVPAVLAAHLFVLGGSTSDSERPIEVGGAYALAPEDFPPVAYVALGHLHRPQELPAPATGAYSGSPLALSFSEAGQSKRVVLVTWEGSPPQARLTWLPLRRGKPLVRHTFLGGAEELLRYARSDADRGAWVEVVVHTPVPLDSEVVREVRRRHPGILIIRPILPETARESISVTADRPPEEFFRRFYRERTGGKDPEEDLVRLFLELLAEGDEGLPAASL
ncbi:exonuclease SbcCD subunit D [Brockia lithotrophica]|uniref:Nuclease SbcCD subunit D n=1 Tax=Brockia lithotrophica TaxID=933949 RepID=A0A660KX54_9BACL|nr:exonuclease SbcCD subunit D [Brockia lithotrophica]RKQ84271.1 exodeoxyribonuclease I subunit D [Brockia lithotrophica]